MSVISYDIYRILFDKSDSLKVLKSIMALDKFEPIPAITETFGADYHEELVADLNSAKKNLEECFTKASKLPNIENTLKKSKSKRLTKEYSAELKNNLEKYFTRIENLTSKIDQYNKTAQEITELEQLKLRFEPLKEMVTEIIFPSDSLLMKSYLCKVQVHLKGAFESYIKDFHQFSFTYIGDDLDFAYFALLTDSMEAGLIDKLIEIDPNIQLIETPEVESVTSPKSFYDETNSSIESKKSEINDLTSVIINEIEDLFPHLDNYLKIIAFEIGAVKGGEYVDSYLGNVENLELNIDHLEEMVQIKGWSDSAGIERIKSIFTEIGVAAYIDKIDPTGRPDIRTGMKNNRFIKPFESVTLLMGTPSENEIDPSPFMSAFFVLYFGFALGDAGYGILMLLASLWYILAKKPVGAARDIFKLLFYCSITTIIFGFMGGSFFGNLTEINLPFAETLLKLKVFDIEESLIEILVLTLVIGFVQQIFGLFLQMLTYIKNKDYYGAFFKSGTWILLLLSFIGVFGSTVIEGGTILSQYSNYIIGGTILLFAFGQGDREKAFYLRPLYGIFALFDITSYLSNTLSYARLLALGLATGVIGSVINLIATIMADPSTPVGFVIFVLILVVGHLFNLALNLLGTFINIVRLQLVEFFPRFFEAKGTPMASVSSSLNYGEISTTLISNNLINK